MAIVVSLEHLAQVNDNPKAKILADTLDTAIENLLKNGKSPMRKVGQLDNRGSHFYLAMYWANELANQTEDATLKATFDKVLADMKTQENDIVSELNIAQGSTENMKGYYLPDTATTFAAMRPSATLNAIIDNL
jgi:isocitrate dehydrogenase